MHITEQKSDIINDYDDALKDLMTNNNIQDEDSDSDESERVNTKQSEQLTKKMFQKLQSNRSTMEIIRNDLHANKKSGKMPIVLDQAFRQEDQDQPPVIQPNKP